MGSTEVLSAEEVQKLRVELREVERHARHLRNRLDSVGGIRRHRRDDLAQTVVNFLESHPGLEFSPGDVRHGIGTDGDVSKMLWNLAAAGRIDRPSRGRYRSTGQRTGGEPNQ